MEITLKHKFIVASNEQQLDERLNNWLSENQSTIKEITSTSIQFNQSPREIALIIFYKDYGEIDRNVKTQYPE